MSSSGLGGGYRRNDDLPPALRSMWRLFKLGYQHEPALLVAAFSFALLQALPDALIALWLKLMSDGATAGCSPERPPGSRCRRSAAGSCASCRPGWSAGSGTG